MMNKGVHDVRRSFSMAHTEEDMNRIIRAAEEPKKCPAGKIP
jgi:hypothetical protein